MKKLVLFFITLRACTDLTVKGTAARLKLSGHETFILDETENERRQENRHSAEKKSTNVLIVGTEWWPRSRNVLQTTVQKDISRLLISQGRNVFITVLDPSEEEIHDANNHGVRLILAKNLPSFRHYSTADKLLLHKHVFPDLHKNMNITLVIGYANIEHDADAAKSIKDSLFWNASFVLLVTYIPEDTDMQPTEVHFHEEDIFEYAKTASTIFSIGPAIYSHFHNKFRALDNDPTHLEFFPGLDDILLKSVINLPNIKGSTIEILMFDFSSRTALNCSNNLFHAAVAIGKVADYFSGAKKIKLKIRGLTDEVGRECKKTLIEHIRSDYLSIVPYPYSNNIYFEIIRDFKQCHLLLFAPWRDPFGIIGLLATAAGVPTLSTDNSGFSEFIKRDMKRHYKVVVVTELGINFDKLKAAEKWEKKILGVLKDSTVYEDFVMNAQILKNDLAESMVSGSIAKSREMVSTTLKNIAENSRDSRETRGNWKDDMADGHGSSTPLMVRKAEVHGLYFTQNGSLQIKVIVENATLQMIEKVQELVFTKIETCKDIPTVRKYLHSIGIKCLHILVDSLSIFVVCPNIQSLDILWARYESQYLQRLIRADIVNTEAYQKLDPEGIILSVSIERWRYRRCRLELLFLNQDVNDFREFGNLQDINGQQMDINSQPYYDHYHLPRQHITSTQFTQKIVNVTSGLDGNYKVARGQDVILIPCLVGVIEYSKEADSIPLLYKQGSDLLIKSHFQHIEVVSIAEEDPFITWLHMFVTFVDVKEDEAGVYTCSHKAKPEKLITVDNSSFLLQVDAKKAKLENRLTLTGEDFIPCMVTIIDSDHRYEESDFLVNITWYQNSEQVKEDGLHIGTSDMYYRLNNSHHQFTSFLSLFNITESLYGKYECEGSVNLRNYDQADNRVKLQFPRIVKKLHDLRPLHWKKQAKELASKVLDSHLTYKNLRSMSAKLIMQHQQLEQFKAISETKTYKIEELSQMVTHLQTSLEDIRSLLLHLLTHFFKWVFAVVLAILLAVNFYQIVRRKIKKREMKRHYDLLEKIANLGLTFRHQCSEYDYDVFISSCEEDDLFVEDELVPKIRMEWHLRKYSIEDASLGVDMITEVSQKMHKSRKTLIVLSQKFIESSWSVHELCLAYHRKFFDSKDSLVILHLSDLIDNPLELQPLLQGNNYVDFRKDRTWQKLKNALMSEVKKK